MSANISTFAVKVKIKSEPYEYYARFGKRISHEIIKMFHFERRSPQQAIQAGRRYGEVVSCEKVNIDEVKDALYSIEDMQLDYQSDVYVKGDSNKNMTTDEMVWRKRNLRRGNMHKDKNND